MILIIGGTSQGKREYARSLGAAEICGGADVSLDRPWEYPCISDFQLLVKRQLEAGKDPVSEAEMMINRNPDMMIISTEIGCGIVPMEKSERLWREAVGKVCCLLAKKSDRVVRLVCGIPAVIKESG